MTGVQTCALPIPPRSARGEGRTIVVNVYDTPGGRVSFDAVPALRSPIGVQAVEFDRLERMLKAKSRRAARVLVRNSSERGSRPMLVPAYHGCASVLPGESAFAWFPTAHLLASAAEDEDDRTVLLAHVRHVLNHLNSAFSPDASVRVSLDEDIAYHDSVVGVDARLAGDRPALAVPAPWGALPEGLCAIVVATNRPYGTVGTSVCELDFLRAPAWVAVGGDLLGEVMVEARREAVHVMGMLPESVRVIAAVVPHTHSTDAFFVDPDTSIDAVLRAPEEFRHLAMRKMAKAGGERPVRRIGSAQRRQRVFFDTHGELRGVSDWRRVAFDRVEMRETPETAPDEWHVVVEEAARSGERRAEIGRAHV